MIKCLKGLAHWEKAVNAFWYRKSVWACFLLPLSWCFQLITYCRWKWHRFKGPVHPGVPVIIVGNITLGGTGKTPFIRWLAHTLSEQGYTPGIVSRGYKSSLNKSQVKLVTPQALAKEVGDEPLMLSQDAFPVVIGVNRVLAVDTLLQAHPEVNIILSDDGLQHYALARDIEIALIEGDRRLGNGMCLPAGPLREPLSRLKKVDFIIANGKALQGEWEMNTQLSPFVYSLSTGEKKALSTLGKEVHAVAGIGNPARFFKMLEDKGLNITAHPFSDHADYCEEMLEFSDDLPVLMTEKDAVKCAALNLKNAWTIPLHVTLPEAFIEQLRRKLPHGQKTPRHSSMSHLQTASYIQKS